MSILTLSSTNPKFSFIIQKNPETIRSSGKPFRRAIRKGSVYGWYTGTNDSSFRLWFKDSPVNSSFASGVSGEFEYLDCSRYGSPYLPISIITNCLDSCSRERHEDDTDNFLTDAEFDLKVCNDRLLNQMVEKYLTQDVVISSSPLAGKYHRINVQAKSVHTVLNVVQILALIQSLDDQDTYVKMDEIVMAKFIKIFNRGNAPYYLRYMFQQKVMTNRATFDKMKSDLETEGMNLCFGDTRRQRYDAISPWLSKGDHLIDIGCGEMYYALRMITRYETVSAIDADEDRSENNAAKVVGREITNINCIHDFVNREFVERDPGFFDGADVLMTEVIEHIEKEDALDTLSAILNTDYNQVIVTVPNKDFNINYGFEGDQMRHYDHKWEPTFEEFCDDMVTLAAESGCEVSVTGIGDCVNDSTVSSMAVFTKKEI